MSFVITKIEHGQSGVNYFFYGLKLCFLPGIRRFVIIPLLVNILLFVGFAFYLYYNLGGWVDGWLKYLPDWLSWLSYIIYPILLLIIIFLFFYFFSTVANLIAAPFNGILSEQLEMRLTGEKVSNQSMFTLLKDAPRMLSREWTKLWYYAPRALGLCILMFIPVIGQTLGALLWFVFSAWTTAIQYCDYPFDNHNISFNKMKQDLSQDKSRTYGFGAIVALFTMIPLVNLIIIPAAVCGATAMWVDQHKANNSPK